VYRHGGVGLHIIIKTTSTIFIIIMSGPPGSIENYTAIKTMLDALNTTIKKCVDHYYTENEQRIIPNFNLKQGDSGFTSYPLDLQRVNDWVEEIEEIEGPISIPGKKPFLGVFARFVGANIRHVSFDTFIEKINLLTNRIELYIKEEKAIAAKKGSNINIVVVLDGALDKSNTWAFLLMWPKLKHHIKYFCENPTEAFELHALLTSENNNKNDKTIIIHPDDCAYTGTQFLDSVKSPLRRAFWDHERANKLMSKSITYIMAIPFISQMARGFIGREQFFEDPSKNIARTLIPEYPIKMDPPLPNGGRPGCIKIFEESEVFQSLYSQLEARTRVKLTDEVLKIKKNGLIDTNITRDTHDKIVNYFSSTYSGEDTEYKEAFEILGQGTHLIYFDHKLADGLSTINKILALSPIYYGGKKWGLLGLISNCDPKVYATLRKDKKTNTLQPTFLNRNPRIPLYDTDFTKENVCPPPYYKEQVYTFNKMNLGPLIPFGKALLAEEGTNSNGFFTLMLNITRIISELEKRSTHMSNMHVTHRVTSPITSNSRITSHTYICGGCRGEIKPPTAVHVCGQCKIISYCNVKCQTTHWENGHSSICNQ
jgi:hypothetical protein